MAEKDSGYTRQITLIVDGYNVIRSSSLYRAHENDPAWDDDFSDAPINPPRERLINDVSSFSAQRYTRVVVVFDGAGNEFSEGEITHEAGMDIIYSPFGKSADSVIEEIVFQTIEDGGEVVVVSSDATVQTTVFKGKVTRMSAEDFGREVTISHRDLEEHFVPTVKNTVEDRLDEKTRLKLQALLDPSHQRGQ